ncbi:hypothetical protein R2F61_06980 [Mollicutes bacterium LVI A0078]|nr:hypothetical protein RZE84_06985 [Mollicutes bacterium LVI A0075]WOO90467.1 hypothetical protein R2F61_06980 [Mollicutes bacterium LVI A0078]
MIVLIVMVMLFQLVFPFIEPIYGVAVFPLYLIEFLILNQQGYDMLTTILILLYLLSMFLGVGLKESKHGWK